MASKTPHASDSSVQREIEAIVLERLKAVLSKEHKCKISFQAPDKSGFIVLPYRIDGQEEYASFQVDFFNHELCLYGEIYAGVETLLPGQKRKVITDVFKLIAIEKLLGKPIHKYIVFVDESIRQKFLSKSWISAAITAFDVKLLSVELTEEQSVKLKNAKKLQGEAFAKASGSVGKRKSLE